MNFFLLGFLALLATTGYSKPTEDIDKAALANIFLPYKNDIQTYLHNHMFDRDIRPNAEYITCDVCKLAFPVIRGLLETGVKSETIAQAIIDICIEFEITYEDMCDGTVRSFADPVIYIIQNKPEYEMGDFCGIINPGCTVVNETLLNWTIDIDRNKPPVKNHPLLPADVQPAKILQLTDVHLDVDYTVGTNAACGKPRCCYEVGSSNPDPNKQAGVFGHYSCALPPRAFDEILKHAKETHEPNLVFLTGDYTHSGIWQYSQEMNGKNIRAVTEKVATAFVDTPVYPLVGNHEPDTVNMYVPEELWDQFDLAWMYETVSAPFGKWLGEEQLKTFKKGGYYSVIPDPVKFPNLQLVVLNTNLCYVQNFWLVYDPIDPTGQLQWFADTMLEAEKAGLNVLIIGHVSPGSGSCWPVWSNWFDDIVNRFENIIRGQFYGHSHTEIYTLTFDRDSAVERPTTVLYTAPSAVTDGMNSGYKIYYADGMRNEDSTWEIYDHETWVLNTTLSNKNDEAVFEKLFSAREAFGIQSMRPYLLYALTKQMIFDEDMFEKIQWFHNKGLTTRGTCNKRDLNCRLNFACETVIAYSGDDSHCVTLRQLAKQSGTIG